MRLGGSAEANLIAEGNGRFRVEGEVIFATVMSLLRKSEILFADRHQIEIDLGGVTHINTAGLALVIEWLRRSRERGQTLQIRRAPAALVALARICEAEPIIASSLMEAPPA